MHSFQLYPSYLKLCTHSFLFLSYRVIYNFKDRQSNPHLSFQEVDGEEKKVYLLNLTSYTTETEEIPPAT